MTLFEQFPNDPILYSIERLNNIFRFLFSGSDAPKFTDLQPGGDGPGPGRHHPFFGLGRSQQVLALGTGEQLALQALTLAAHYTCLHGLNFTHTPYFMTTSFKKIDHYHF